MALIPFASQQVFHKSCSHTYKELISNKRKNGAFPSNKEANVKVSGRTSVSALAYPVKNISSIS